MITKKRIGVFGCGNMGKALVLAMSARFPDAEFILFTPSLTRAQNLAAEVSGVAVLKVELMPIDLDWYVLGFKPQTLPEFSFEFPPTAKIISVLAGVSTQKLSEKFNIKKIARLMPNTPSSIGAGANLLYTGLHFNEAEKNELNELLNATGSIFQMASEADLDLTTAFSGSGPALLFELARIFEAELTRMTDGRVPAKKIIAQTFVGSAGLMNSSTSFEELRSQVTSKKGVTHEALMVLENASLQSIFSRAFTAAYDRTLELSK